MGPPVVPRPGSRRGRMVARQRADDSQGRFNERVLQFNFGAVAPATTKTLIETITSQGGRFVRCVAMRGTLGTSRLLPATGLELAQAPMRVQINGQQELVTGNVGSVVTMATLFDDITSPWLWWLAPILLRTGDRFAITVGNTTSGETAPTFFPEIGLRIMDEDLWQELYSRDWRKERT